MYKLFLFFTIFIFIVAGCSLEDEGEASVDDGKGSGSDSENPGPGSDSHNPDSDTSISSENGNSETEQDGDQPEDPWELEDADGDGIPNGIEGKEDSDGDGKPNFEDLDSDGDTIPDSVEGDSDKDGDGTPDFLDEDSDNDTITDKEEAGTNGDEPKNSDKDDTPDYLDLDSDNDGIPDKTELEYGIDPYNKDSDGDGSDDLAEQVYGSDPKDPNDKIPDHLFYVVLPYNAPEEVTRKLDFSTNIDKVDVALTIDLSGSMEGEIENLKEGIKSKIIDGIKTGVQGLDLAFGLTHFMDWDNPYNMDLLISSADGAAQTAVDNLPGTGGGDENHSETLYQMSTGEGLHTILEENEGFMWSKHNIDIPSPDCSGAEGNRGGMCFREGAMPIIIMITDEDFEDIPKFEDAAGGFPPATARWAQGEQPGHSRDEAASAMGGLGVKFIGIDSSCEVGDGSNDCSQVENYSAKEDYTAISEATASKHRVTGEAFNYTIASDGTGLSEKVAEAVVDLTTYVEMDVATGGASEEMCGDKSAAGFIKSGKPLEADPADGVDGTTDTTFLKVNPGTNVTFDILFHNDFCKLSSPQPTEFRAKVQVLGDGTPLSSKEVIIIIPGVIQH